MRPGVEEFRASCPEVDDRFLHEHLTRLRARYFERFSHGQICQHLNTLSRLSPENPVKILLDIGGDEELWFLPDGGQNDQSEIRLTKVDCTVLAFDYPGLFSIITGVLAGMGFHILSGDVFTYLPATVKPPMQRRRRRSQRRSSAQDLLLRRRIVDHFSG
ncbi:MAG: hypothetical protein P8017_17710, partial [Deltaproteobacteria bacterium]